MRHNDDCPKRPNGLGISGGAPIDRYGCRAGSDRQKSPDLGGATRRPLHARVGRARGGTVNHFSSIMAL